MASAIEKVLVTGATGYIGGTRHKHLLDRGSHGILLRLPQFDW